MRKATRSARFGWAIVLAFLLALRLLSPAGFMPAFDHGAVTIVACPDAVPIQAHHHHHGDHKLLHQPCPYASASALGALGPDWPVLAALAAVALALLLGRASVFVERHNNHERPPLRGPPIPA